MSNQLGKDFTDDSSTSLGLDHSADPFKGGGIEKFDRAERAVIEANLKAKFDKRTAELVKDGHTIKRARELAREEFDNPKLGRERKAEQAADNHVRGIENLADMRRKTGKHGHGSKSKRKTVVKSGKPICLNCHLEADNCWCICANGGQVCVPCQQWRNSRSKRGRPPAGKRPRSTTIRIKVSARVAALLPGSGVSAGEMVETLVEAAVANGLQPGAVVAALQDGATAA